MLLNRATRALYEEVKRRTAVGLHLVTPFAYVVYGDWERRVYPAPCWTARELAAATEGLMRELSLVAQRRLGCASLIASLELQPGTLLWSKLRQDGSIDVLFWRSNRLVYWSALSVQGSRTLLYAQSSQSAWPPLQRVSLMTSHFDPQNARKRLKWSSCELTAFRFLLKEQSTRLCLFDGSSPEH